MKNSNDPGSLDGLLHDLSPNVTSYFHPFVNLPIELRQLIYEQYLLENGRSYGTVYDRAAICSDWPDIEPFSWYLRIMCPWYLKPRVIIPALCLINRTIGKEALEYLLGQGDLKIVQYVAYSMPYLARIETICRGVGINMAEHIRKITIPDVNGMGWHLSAITPRATQNSTTSSRAPRERTMRKQLRSCLPISTIYTVSVGWAPLTS